MDWQAFRVSLSLGLWTVALLVPVGMWAGHHLATRTFRGKAVLEAAVAIPLLLPPTVLGFYLLTVFSPRSAVGAFFEQVAGAPLAFSFPGLVLASVIINLPFVIQPIQRAFEAIPADVRDAAACCGLSPWQRFLRIEAPLAARVEFLLQDYDYAVADPAWLVERLGHHKGLQSNETLAHWRALVEARDFPALVEELLTRHYDALYQRSQAHNYDSFGEATRYSTGKLDAASLDRLAAEILAQSA
jgi:hypothetical protein